MAHIASIYEQDFNSWLHGSVFTISFLGQPVFDGVLVAVLESAALVRVEGYVIWVELVLEPLA